MLNRCPQITIWPTIVKNARSAVPRSRTIMIGARIVRNVRNAEKPGNTDIRGRTTVKNAPGAVKQERIIIRSGMGFVLFAVMVFLKMEISSMK